MYNNILNFFLNFLAHDQELFLSIKNSDENIKLKGANLVFSLKGLYLFLSNEQFIPKETSFSAFKKCLYRDGLINQALKAHNGMIEVYQSSPNVDSSIYSLKSLFDNNS